MPSLRPHIFLVDGLGAVASTAATGFLLPAFQPWIGLPREVLIAMAAPAALFAAYSLACWLLEARPTPWLVLIIGGNLAYCAVVTLVLAWFVHQLTPWGIAYFGGEIALVLGIVAFESQIVRAHRA